MRDVKAVDAQCSVLYPTIGATCDDSAQVGAHDLVLVISDRPSSPVGAPAHEVLAHDHARRLPEENREEYAPGRAGSNIETERLRARRRLPQEDLDVTEIEER